MPLQNRVDPFGAIHAAPARGLFTGNRGVIHDPGSRTLLKRRWTTKAWIVCECAFRGRRRAVMGRNAAGGGAGWTELFFLDEVTALAAGHRPCFYCRRAPARAFAEACGDAVGAVAPRAPEIDARLHAERPASGGKAVAIAASDVPDLPDGAMIALDGKPYAVRDRNLLQWSFDGYGPAPDPAALEGGTASLITPATTLAALRAGYEPVWHPSAAS